MGKRTNTAVWMEKHQRWQIKVQKDGKRRSFYSSTPGKKGQREANAKADEWLDSDVTADKRVSQLYEDFLAAQKKRSATSSSNYVKLESIGRVWILPEIGHLKINKVTEQKLQDIIDNACALKRSKKTVMNIRSTITAFIKYCRKAKATTLFPEDLTLAASLRYKGKRVLSPKDLKTLFTVDTTMYKGKVIFDNLIYAYRLQVILGLRPGELLAIEKAKISDSNLFMNHSKNIYGEITDGKNENAVRVTSLNSLAREIIQNQLQLDTTSKYLFGDLSQGYYYKRWNKYCESNNISYVSPYELRHTFVSVIKTMPESDVKFLVGHSKDMDTFGVYGHEMEGDRQRIAKQVEKIFQKIIN